MRSPSLWKSLNINYHPPIVERLYTDLNSYRICLHVIHPTDEVCLFHKHRWPSVIKVVKGCYEMGITYSEKEVTSEEASKLPTLSKLILNEGSYYEMTQTDALHYVKPLSKPSYSIMITHSKLYPEDRTEANTVKLDELTSVRKDEILEIFKTLM